MILGIDGNEANVVEKVGIGQYAFNILTYLNWYIGNLKQMKGIQTDEVRIYLKNHLLDDLPLKKSWWNYQIFGPKIGWTQIALPIRLYREKNKVDVFFTPSHYAPRFCPSPVVISVMDLSFIHFPQMFNLKDLYQLTHWTEYSVKKARKILTISEFSKKAIIKHYKLASDRVVVTYPGYDTSLYRPISLKDKERSFSDIRKQYGISSKFILFVGTLQPRKNITGLIEAFNILLKDKQNKDLQLVVIGKRGWLYDEIFSKVKELGLKGKVIFADFVQNDDLVRFYSNANCLVLPSYYEGFGIPLIEAMACGCPIVASNLSSIPEIVANAGLLIDPYDTGSIVKAVKQVLNNADLREQLVKLGLKRVQLFNWQKCAKKTYEVLNTISGE